MNQSIRFRLAGPVGQTALDEAQASIAGAAPEAQFSRSPPGAGAAMAEAVLVVLIPAVAKVLVAAISAFGAYVASRRKSESHANTVILVRGTESTRSLEVPAGQKPSTEAIEQALLKIGDVVEVVEKS